MGARPAHRLRMEAVLALSAAAAMGCGGTADHPLVGTERAPGADGLVQVEPIEGGNSLVTLSLERLLPPRRLGEQLDAYVVWFSSEGGAVLRAGALEYDEEARTGRMMATTPLRHFTVAITAEQDTNVESPSDVVVVQREVSAD